jgi:hypothetical protein
MSISIRTKDSKAKVSTKLSDEQRRNCIEIAAYYIAENRGFSGCDLENWQVAEAKIDRLLVEGKLQPQL